MTNTNDKAKAEAIEQAADSWIKTQTGFIHDKRKGFIAGATFAASLKEPEENQLATFLTWVDRKTHFFQDKDVTVKQVVSEYLNNQTEPELAKYQKCNTCGGKDYSFSGQCYNCFSSILPNPPKS